MRLRDPFENDAVLYAKEQATEGGPRVAVVITCDLNDDQGARQMLIGEWGYPPGVIEDTIRSRSGPGDREWRGVMRVIVAEALEALVDFEQELAE